MGSRTKIIAALAIALAFCAFTASANIIITFDQGLGSGSMAEVYQAWDDIAQCEAEQRQRGGDTERDEQRLIAFQKSLHVGFLFPGFRQPALESGTSSACADSSQRSRFSMM